MSGCLCCRTTDEYRSLADFADSDAVRHTSLDKYLAGVVGLGPAEGDVEDVVADGVVGVGVAVGSGASGPFMGGKILMRSR